MEQPPGDGPDLVEQRENPPRSGGIDRPGGYQEPEVGVGFLGGAVGDPPVLEPIPTRSAMTLGEICRHRARSSHELIGN
jgi:hypothetical protein